MGATCWPIPPGYIVSVRSSSTGPTMRPTKSRGRPSVSSKNPVIDQPPPNGASTKPTTFSSIVTSSFSSSSAKKAEPITTPTRLRSPPTTVIRMNSSASRKSKLLPTITSSWCAISDPAMPAKIPESANASRM